MRARCSATFADSTCSQGGPYAKYILAQFREDADLDWVARARSALNVDELKDGVLRERRPWLKTRPELWGKIERGISQASVMVIDPEPHRDAIRRRFLNQGRQQGIDFSERDLIDGCAVSLIRYSPVAYLPTQIACAIDAPEPHLTASSETFSPQAIRRRIGPSLRSARMMAARAYAIWDVPTAIELGDHLLDTLRSPLAEVVLSEVGATQRVFDEGENPRTLSVLNEAAELISARINAHRESNAHKRPIASEGNSRRIDHLQAADVAAGRAREVIDCAGCRGLGGVLEKVWVNGKRIK